MSYAQPQRDLRQYSVGLAAVVAFHVLLAYALATGLARKVVEVLKAPLSVNVMEEVKTLPPPPPPKYVPPPPKTATPPPPDFVPQVEVPVQVTPPPVVVATSPEPPPAPPPVAPPAPVAPPVANVAVACPNHAAVRSQVPYPPQAERMGLSGDVVVDFTVGTNGEVKDVTVSRSSNAIFNAAATAAVARLRCTGQGHDVRVRVPFAFRLGN